MYEIKTCTYLSNSEIKKLMKKVTLKVPHDFDSISLLKVYTFISGHLREWNQIFVKVIKHTFHILYS